MKMWVQWPRISLVNDAISTNFDIVSPRFDIYQFSIIYQEMKKLRLDDDAHRWTNEPMEDD